MIDWKSEAMLQIDVEMAETITSFGLYCVNKSLAETSRGHYANDTSLYVKVLSKSCFNI